ncbi:MAG: hypothetical protein ACXVAX_01005 [Pseudobdellovibrio sp.]
MQQILLTLFSYFFSKRNHDSNPHGSLIDAVKVTIRAEASALIFKTLIGIVLAGAAIFSFIQFGKALEVLFSQYENGVTFQLVTFIVTTALCCTLLYFLFKKPNVPHVDLTAHQPHHLEGVLANFTEGLMQGLEKIKVSETQNPPPPADFN